MSGRMGTAANVPGATIGRLRPAAGLTLLGEDPSSGIPGSRFLVRRADRQVIQLSPLPYLVAVAIAEVAAAGNNGRVGTDGADPVLVAARVSRDSGQHVTAADVRSLVTDQLGPLGVVTAPKKAHRPRRRTIVLGAAAALAAVAGATLAVVAITRPGQPPAKATASEVQVAAWVARQVNPGTVVSCDPVICGLLRRDGFPASRLLTLGPATRDPLGSGVVVATSAVRNEFGARLATVYAPLVVAGFGAGPGQVQVRAIAPGGAAALASQLAAQHALLASEGRALLQNRTIQATPAARSALLAGHVDPRLMATLSVLSGQQPIELVAFDPAAPGASPAVPVRGVQLGAASASGRSAILAFLGAQRGAYRPAVAAAGRDADGQSVVTVRFDAPDPLTNP